MLMPKKTRYRKQQRGRMRGKSWTGQTVSFGDFGLKALGAGMDHESADRVGQGGHYPVRAADRSRVDPDIPG